MIPDPRPKQKGTKARHILSVPFTPEQIADLARRAGQRPLSAFVRDHLYPANDNNQPRLARPRSREMELFAAKALALLGPTATSLKSIAQAMSSGLVPFTPDTEAAIVKACADIAEIKTLLMKALRIRER